MDAGSPGAASAVGVMVERWLDVDWFRPAPVRDPEVAAWTAATLARIAEGGREEEVASWRARRGQPVVVSRPAGQRLFVDGKYVGTTGGARPG